MTGVHSFTGHRPDKLGGYGPVPERRLITLAMDVLRVTKTEIAIVGMALGWDQAVATACVNLSVPFVAAVPFPDQEKRWPQPAQKRYRRLLALAQDTHLVHAERPVNNGHAAGLLDARNKWMVRESSHLQALWNGDPKGGTANCIAFAKANNTPFTNHWLSWADPMHGMFEDILGS